MVGSEMSSYSPTHRCNSLPLKPGLDVKDKSSAYEQEKMNSNNNNNNNVDDDDSNNCNDFTARDYQDELLSFAVKENAILYLPTGSGKTFIATMLIKSFSSFIERPFSEGFKGSKRAFFLVNTVELVNQQAKAIRRHTSFKVGQYSGDMNVDLWTKERWLQELEFNSVIVMTAQILLNMLQHYYLKVNDIKVIVFDECHRAVKDHPMRSIMRYFERVPQDEQPRVLGLTGSLLNSTIKTSQVSSYIRDMENTFLSRIITAKSEDMANQINSFSTDPTEELIKYTSEDDNEIPLFTKCNCKFDELKSVIKCITLEDILEKPAKPQVGCVQMNDEFKLNKKLGNMVDDIVILNTFRLVNMERYTKEQGVFIIKTFFENGKSFQVVIRKFRTKFGRENAPTNRAIKLMVEKFEETGSIHDNRNRIYQRSGCSTENIAAVSRSVEEDPKTSIRHRSQQLNIKRSTLFNILHRDLHLKAYKIQLTQELKPADHALRRQFVSWAIETQEENENFLNKIIFTDEAHFQLNGYVNKQNCRIWGEENPRVILEQPLHPQKVTVWWFVVQRNHRTIFF